jgi:hypothetical protein
MRAIVLLIMAVALAACCQCPQRSPEAPAQALPPAATTTTTPAVVIVEKATTATEMVEPIVSTGEGDVVCRKGGDERTVTIHELKNGRCMLVYNNTVSGNGTENTLPDRAACELQQQRMKNNFVRSGFSCN